MERRGLLALLCSYIFSLFVLRESLTISRLCERPKGGKQSSCPAAEDCFIVPISFLYPSGFLGLLAKTRFFWNSEATANPSQCPGRNKISRCARNDWGRLQQPRIRKTIITLPANYDMVQHIYANRLASIFQVPGNPFVLLAGRRIPGWMVVYNHHRCS